MEKFDTFLLAYLVFSTEQLSINLQAVYITIQEALNGLITHLKSLQDASFNHFYDARRVKKSHVFHDTERYQVGMMKDRLTSLKNQRLDIVMPILKLWS